MDFFIIIELEFIKEFDIIVVFLLVMIDGILYLDNDLKV